MKLSTFFKLAFFVLFIWSFYDFAHINSQTTLSCGTIQAMREYPTWYSPSFYIIIKSEKEQIKTLKVSPETYFKFKEKDFFCIDEPVEINTFRFLFDAIIMTIGIIVYFFLLIMLFDNNER